MSAVDDNSRSPEQVAREQALAEVSDVLLNLEHTIARSRKALARVHKIGGDHTIELALIETIDRLEKAHKAFMQSTYYAGSTVRLF